MRDFLTLLQRFKSDERGVFIVFFGVIAIVLIATAGAVVDFTTIEQARARAQDALDSAALGLQPTIFDDGVTEETIEPQAQQLLDERLADASVTADITDVAINVTDGMLRLQASITVPMSFVALVGIENVTANVLSEATRKRLNVEVAMVLDNSGSMASASRMDNLKAAATCATNILFNSDCASTATAADTAQVKIGIVPFTEFVNVGTGYKTATWMDTTGVSPIANDNFDTDDNPATPYTGAVNRFALYDALTNADWQGCVEARPYPYDTNDTPPNPAVPATLFVPEFAPDTPDSGGYTNNYLDDNPAACHSTTLLGTCQVVEVRTQCLLQLANFCSGGPSYSYKLNGLNVAAGTCSCDGEASTTTTAWTGSFLNYTMTKTTTCQDYLGSGATAPTDPRARQERICKYTGAISTSGGKGPNWDCPTNALLPLTNTKSSVVAAINAMYPQGYTNIHQGAIWGFHMLSPTEPLTEAEDYDSATYKVMIIMTDGENTVDGYSASNMNKANGYMAYGFPGPPVASGTAYNGRIYSTTYPTPASGAEVTSAMDTRTVETCTNAKTAGITIYTIGLNAPNETTETMLRNCASSAAHAYFPTASSELISVFTEIASQLSNLRLAR